MEGRFGCDVRSFKAITSFFSYFFFCESSFKKIWRGLIDRKAHYSHISYKLNIISDLNTTPISPRVTASCLSMRACLYFFLFARADSVPRGKRCLAKTAHCMHARAACCFLFIQMPLKCVPSKWQMFCNSRRINSHAL